MVLGKGDTWAAKLGMKARDAWVSKASKRVKLGKSDAGQFMQRAGWCMCAGGWDSAALHPACLVSAQQRAGAGWVSMLGVATCLHSSMAISSMLPATWRPFPCQC